MTRALRSRPRPAASTALVDQTLDALRSQSAPLPDSHASPLITHGRLRSDAARFRKQQAQAVTPPLPSGIDCSIDIPSSLPSPEPIRFFKSAPHAAPGQRSSSSELFPDVSEPFHATSSARIQVAPAAHTAESSLLRSLASSDSSFASSLASELLGHCRTCHELVPANSDGVAMCTKPKLRHYFSFMMLSHIPFAIAIGLAFTNAHTLKAFVYTASLIASLMYHRSREHQFCKIDVFLACALVATNCVRLWEQWMWIPVSADTRRDVV